jgi:hypothetical protein
VKAHLVAEALGSDDGDLIADALVGLEVERQLGVVPLNDDLGGLLDGLSANATHFWRLDLAVTCWIRETTLVNGKVDRSAALFWGCLSRIFAVNGGPAESMLRASAGYQMRLPKHNRSCDILLEDLHSQTLNRFNTPWKVVHVE